MYVHEDASRSLWEIELKDNFILAQRNLKIHAYEGVLQLWKSVCYGKSMK